MKNLVLIAIILIANSCKNAPNNKDVIDKVNDSVYLKKTFYKGFKVSEYSIYKKNIGDTVKNGIYNLFYENGNVKETGFYKSGIKDSNLVKYYIDGTKKGEYHFFNGRLIGTQLDYSEDGDISRIYLSGNLDSAIFIATLKNNKIVNFGGIPLHVIFNGITHKINEPFDIVNELIETDYLKSVLYITMIDERTGKTSTDKVDRFVKSGNDRFSFLQWSFSKPGKYLYKVKVELRSLDNSLILTDSLQKTLNVID